MKRIRIATRESQLALWQARHVRGLLREKFPGIEVRLVPMTTLGDQVQDKPLASIGGKGLFLKELEQALFAGRADLAVHSLKDVPAVLPAGLVMPAFLPRADPADAFVSGRYPDLQSLPPGAVVGTSSLRRRSHLLALRKDLEIRDLRGNVNTRLAKLDAGKYDAIILACAGLQRLGLAERIRARLPVQDWLPSPGQAIIGIECLQDHPVAESLRQLDDPQARCMAVAERALAARLQAGCHWPLAALAEVAKGRLRMVASLSLTDASMGVRVAGEEDCAATAALGTRLAEEMLAAGGEEIIAHLGASG